MYIRTENKDNLDGENNIWRYMTFEKFLNILLKKELYFSNLEILEDENEGTLNEKTKKFDCERLKNITNDEVEAKKISDANASNVKNRRKNAFVTCWSIDEEESFALWKIYLNKSKYGIAIKTNIESILACFTGFNPSKKTLDELHELKIVFAKVDYFGKEKLINIYEIASDKRIWYSYEKEFRGIIHLENDLNKIGNGVSLNIDLSKLIKEIYIPPMAPDWFYELVKNTIAIYLDKEYRIDVPVLKSKIQEEI